MRALKFRVFDKRNQKMYTVKNITFDYETGQANYVGVLDYMYGLQIDDNIALMQYTGLNDVAGNPIYEGDILGMENLTAVVVFWESPPEFGLDHSHNENDDEWCDDWNLADDSWRMEIIGNVYETPELIGKAKEA